MGTSVDRDKDGCSYLHRSGLWGGAENLKHYSQVSNVFVKKVLNAMKKGKTEQGRELGVLGAEMCVLILSRLEV